MKRQGLSKQALLVMAALVMAAGILVIIFLSRPRPATVPALKPSAIAGRIAIVIDDVGYNHECVEYASAIRYPLTFAVLPNLPYSRSAAASLHGLGFEVILHLPMEPKGAMELEKNTIMQSMSKETVRSVVKDNLNAVPHVKGVNNHMGSRATEDREIMDTVLSELRGRRLYFLDSFVTGQSVAQKAARGLRVKYARRNVFLDNERKPEAIRRQLEGLKERSRRYGYAIGIGHDHKTLYAVLAEEMPVLAAQGYKFVLVSELVE